MRYHWSSVCNFQTQVGFHLLSQANYATLVICGIGLVLSRAQTGLHVYIATVCGFLWPGVVCRTTSTQMQLKQSMVVKNGSNWLAHCVFAFDKIRHRAYGTKNMSELTSSYLVYLLQFKGTRHSCPWNWLFQKCCVALQLVMKKTYVFLHIQSLKRALSGRFCASKFA